MLLLTSQYNSHEGFVVTQLPINATQTMTPWKNDLNESAALAKVGRNISESVFVAITRVGTFGAELWHWRMSRSKHLYYCTCTKWITHEWKL